MTYKDYMTKKHRELTEQIRQANHEYYIKDSPTQTVGHSVKRTKFKKVRHRTPMLSLANLYSGDEVIEWCAGIERELSKKHKK